MQFCGGLRAVLAAAGVDVSRCTSPGTLPGNAGSLPRAAQAACAGSVSQGSSEAQPTGSSAGGQIGTPAASGIAAGAVRGTCAGVAAAQPHAGTCQPLGLATDAGSDAGGSGRFDAAPTSVCSRRLQGLPSHADSGGTHTAEPTLAGPSAPGAAASSQQQAPAACAAEPTAHGAADACQDMEPAAPADGTMVEESMASCQDGTGASKAEQPSAAPEAGNACNAELQPRQQVLLPPVPRCLKGPSLHLLPLTVQLMWPMGLCKQQARRRVAQHVGALLDT